MPEQQTDFIFTVVGEELGFVGRGHRARPLRGDLWRIWRIASIARDPLRILLCIGVLAMFAFQVFENVGMTMGIMPVTGIPLPFMSLRRLLHHRGFAAIGLVLNVHMRRFR